MNDKLDQLKAWLQEWLHSEQASDGVIDALWQTIETVVQEREAKSEKPISIAADTVRLVVTDAKTGHSYLRSLPLDYLETANGVTLSGETYAAKPVQIAFYSEPALERLRELQGEDDGCGHHHDHDHDHDHD